MATSTPTVHIDDDSPSSSDLPDEEISDGVEIAARAGYTAKGVVYAIIGGLAFQQAIGSGGQTSGSRGALDEIASAPFGQVLLWIMALGLAAYVLWRLVQAFVDPEADASDEGDAKRWAKRGFFLVSAVLYGFLTWYAVQLAIGGGGAGGGGSGGSGGTQGMVAETMQMSWGRWLVGALAVIVVARGLVQLYKAYTESFKEKISSFDLGPARRSWVIRASRLGLTARAVVFGIIGTSIGWAAVRANPSEAQGLEGSLDVLVGRPWLLGAVGLGLVGYAVYQWVKARYRLIGV